MQKKSELIEFTFGKATLTEKAAVKLRKKIYTENLIDSRIE